MQIIWLLCHLNLLLPAGSSKTVRFVAMEPEQKEKNYRVKFEAVPSIDDVATDKKDLSMQLTVNLIWGIVVSVPPSATYC
ncbi:hypothetical protein HTZ85_16110 [Escherichia coli]|nr:hypothetical protein [Escherichia coli]